MILLGVDGGNTKTVAVAARSDGTVLGYGRAGCADIYWSDTAIEAIRQAAAEALGDHLADVAACSLAGADWPEDFDYLRSHLQSLAPSLLVVNDALGALRASLPGGVGVSLALGTGTALAARNLDGRTWHSSYWSDVQGSRHLGDKALIAVYRAELGVGPSTALTEKVLTWAGESRIEEVLHAMTRRVGPHPDAGLLVPALLDTALQGDSVANAIVSEHAHALGEFIRAAARRVGLADPFDLSLSGGVLRRSGFMRSLIEQHVPQARSVEPRFEPVIGALLLAFETAGIEIYNTLLNCLEQR